MQQKRAGYTEPCQGIENTLFIVIARTKVPLAGAFSDISIPAKAFNESTK